MGGVCDSLCLAKSGIVIVIRIASHSLLLRLLGSQIRTFKNSAW